MGYDYWFVHFTWTIPPALCMTALYWPFFTKLEVSKIFTLITIAVVATTPWDSYLVRNKIWSYPPDAVAGATLFSIPLEEVFFFVIQTYNTGLLYVILTKRLVLPAYLEPSTKRRVLPSLVTLVICGALLSGVACFWYGGKYTYLGLILLWVSPVVLLQWVLCCRFLVALPRKDILLAIGIPSFYLCMVDNLALQRGTWVIEHNTKLDFRVWGALEFEEALFFFVTNIMIILGLVAFDHAVAIAEYNIASAPETVRHFPSIRELVVSYIFDRPDSRSQDFLQGLTNAVGVVSRKSQSMYMGSAMFQGCLRIDLLLLYSFCRVIDDLVDEAPDREAASSAIELCCRELRSHFANPACYDAPKTQNEKSIATESPLQASIALLPASRLTIDPLLRLLDGFETDLSFSFEKESFPIATEEDLEEYADNVAGSVAASMLELVFAHYPSTSSHMSARQKGRIIKAGEQMGRALQYVNIARDVADDAAIGRVYMPTSWLSESGLAPVDVVSNPHHHPDIIAKLRFRMLDKADEAYALTVDAIAELPAQVRGPVRTVVDSYMAIGKRLRQRPSEDRVGKGKLKLPIWRRLWVAWWAMCCVA